METPEQIASWCVVFVAFSNFAFRGDWPSAAGLIASLALAAYLHLLHRSRGDELEAVRKELKEMGERINSIAIAKGWK